MSKPDWCPQEVWDKSDVELAWTAASTDGEVITALRVQIARALLAAKAEEREACAYHLEMTARAVPKGHESPTRGAATYNWLMHCAGLIRKRGAL